MVGKRIGWVYRTLSLSFSENMVMMVGDGVEVEHFFVLVLCDFLVEPTNKFDIKVRQPSTTVSRLRIIRSHVNLIKLREYQIY